MTIGSSATWAWGIARLRQGQPVLPREPHEPIRWHPAVVAIACGWLALGYVDRIQRAIASGPPPETPAPPSIDGVLANIGLTTGVLLLFLLALLAQSPRRNLGDYGITPAGLARQARDALGGFLFAALPVALLMGAMARFRTEETQHSLLKLLQHDPRWQTVAAVAVLAVVLAPLIEELLLRVMIQGWLTTQLAPWQAILVTALLFSFSHGWRDGIPLIPLALTLGYVYDRTHRYFAVVLLHALFNGTMLVLQLLSVGAQSQ